MTTLLPFLAGLAFLVAGAELLVRGAARLAAAAGISPLVIGLTVVAFGTSSPELAVSVRASVAGQTDIALGNVVGSNIFNILFILGVSALIVPLVVAQQLVRLDVPIMIAASTVLFLLGLDGRIGRLDGVVLFAGIVVYTAFSIAQSRKASAAVRAEYREAYGAQRPRGLGLLLNLGLVLGGLALLLVGAHWLVDSAVAAARRIGVSELIVGLTIVAAGTSLPEVAASLVAAVRGERDIAAGNVIGSNIFNILSILGISAVVADGGLPIDPALLRFDVPVMIAVAIATLPICFTGYRISRWEGLLFLGYYLAYTLYLILKAAEHDALYAYSAVMLFFVVPLTAATIAVLVFRALKARYAP